MTELRAMRLKAKTSHRPARRVKLIQDLCLGSAGVIAATVLAAWLVPGLARLLPSGWTVMKANTALVIILNTLSLALSGSDDESVRRRRVSSSIAWVAALISIAVLMEYWLKISIGIDTLLAADRLSAHPGRMSPQTAVSFSLLGLLVATTPIRTKRGAWIADFGVLTLCYLVLMIASGYLFGALHLFGLSMGTRVSPQTLACLTLLTYVVIARRVKSGLLSILSHGGIGGHLARTVSPVVLLLPFALEVGRVNFRLGGVISPQYAAALATALTAVSAFAFVLFIAWRIDGLERQIQALSLRDDLTGLQNRKGFFVSAERALSFARASCAPFSVLFIDVDNLKMINDALGHDAGSQLLRDFAAVITHTFRRTDVLGRIGGDEFVVAGMFSEAEVEAAAERLERASRQLDPDPSGAYSFGFSFGYATSKADATESLDQLIGKADLAMYEAKRSKRILRRLAYLEN